MEPENPTVIDVQAEEIDSSPPESIDQWYSAQQMTNLLRLSKSGFQQAITKLQDIYGISLKVLRRGEARATQYSEFALKACRLLNAGRLSELRKLIESVPTTATSTAIVFLDQHQQIAQTASTVADNNLNQITSLKAGLLSNYRELGRALGKQAAAEVQLGFTEEVAAGLKKLQES